MSTLNSPMLYYITPTWSMVHQPSESPGCSAVAAAACWVSGRDMTGGKTIPRPIVCPFYCFF